MPRKKNVLPSYLLYQVAGREPQARVRIGGKDYLLGPYGSEESRIKYGQLISQTGNGVSVDPLGNRGTVTRNEKADAGLSVAELLLAYKRHADAYYVNRDGKPTDEVHCLVSAMRPVRELFAMLPAKDFAPLNLKAIQKQYVEAGWTRGYCNASTNRIRRIFKWGVGEGLVPVTTWQALTAVPPLKMGHSAAPDNKPRQAVSDEQMEAVRPHLALHFRDLFDLMRATGARPSELIALSMADINTTGEIWIADLAEHKNAHRGLSRKLFFGPQAQLVLRRCPATGPLFNFERRTFSRNVKHACIAAGIPPFVPYCLRHSKATALRDTIGIEAAQACLGHAQPSMTARYSTRMDKLAIEAAKACG